MIATATRSARGTNRYAAGAALATKARGEVARIQRGPKFLGGNLRGGWPSHAPTGAPITVTTPTPCSPHASSATPTRSARAEPLASDGRPASPRTRSASEQNAGRAASSPKIARFAASMAMFHAWNERNNREFVDIAARSPRSSCARNAGLGPRARPFSYGFSAQSSAIFSGNFWGLRWWWLG